MVAAFHHRFPQAHVACEAVEDSRFVDRSFDGILAWGLMFLLPAEAQRALIRMVAMALNPGGRFLFTSPALACTWADAVTGRQSLSLGAKSYTAVLSDANLVLIGEHIDEGDNHYYEVISREADSTRRPRGLTTLAADPLDSIANRRSRSESPPCRIPRHPL
jgi:hypothetical protein